VYVGGEILESGDTKCDLTIRPLEINVASHIQQLNSSPTVTIVSEGEINPQEGISQQSFICKYDFLNLSL
jgi:hypothetical protein